MTRPKHSSGRPDGQRSAGHKRWARAAGNAGLHPNSKSAILYLTRVTKAFAIAEAVRNNGPDALDLDPRQAYVFRDVRWVGKVIEGKYVATRKVHRVATTCSVYCMAMQAQLYGSVAVMLEATVYDDAQERDMRRIEPVDRKTLRTGTRCTVCDSRVK